MYADPLLDKAFLKQLDEVNERTIYAKVIALDWDEQPIAEIQGMLTAGTINIDGSSAVRRTCNLTMVVNTIDIQNVDWALRTKIRLYIGLENSISEEYGPIIWFPQGIFVLSSFSNTYNSSGYTINLLGRDKMCLLNGDLGGNLFATHDFGKSYTFNNDGTYLKEDIPIKTIIKEAVHTYAQEPYENIFINDLDTCGVELVEYRGDAPCFITKWFNEDGSQKDSYDFEVSEYDLSISDTELESKIDLTDCPAVYVYEYCWRNRLAAQNPQEPSMWDILIAKSKTRLAAIFKKAYVIKRATYGDTVGYRPTELTYAGDLIVDLNGTITSMLDKIVEMLGEFEYFYTTEGKFIFQRKKIYFNSSWSNAVVDDLSLEKYYDASATASKFSYEFKSHYLIESILNKPDLKSIKNDFGIWGKRTSAGGDLTDLHMRYAIDKKPSAYYSCKHRTTYHAENAEVPLNQCALEIRAAKTALLIDENASYEYIQTWLRTNRNLNFSIEEISNAVRADMSGYDWRQLIYFMAEDNLLSDTRIAALKKCLTLNMYLYDPTLIDKSMWGSTYYFNAITNAFYPMTYDTSGEGKEDPSVIGFNRLSTYLVNGNAIYGKDPSFSYYTFTTEEEQTLQQAAQQKLQEHNNALAPLIQNAQDSYTSYMAGFYNHQSTLQYEYFDPRSLTYHNYLTNAERTSAFLVAWTAYVSELVAIANASDPNVYPRPKDKTGHTKNFTAPGLHLYYRWANLIGLLWTLNDAINDDPITEGLLVTKVQLAMKKEIEQWKASFNTGYDAYYADILAFWPLMYKINQDHNYEYNTDGTLTFDEAGNPIEAQTVTYELLDDGSYKQVLKQKMTLAEFGKWIRNGYWDPGVFVYSFINREVTISEPNMLRFWLDFIDYRGELYLYIPPLIGRRSKVLKDDKVKAIYYKDVPPILFIDNSLDPDQLIEGWETLAYNHVNTNAWLNTYLYISSQGKSAKEELDNLLYKHTYYQDTITLQTIPIYYLEPNTRILVQDTKTGIDGEYLIKSLSISLAHDGMMSITANRAEDRII